METPPVNANDLRRQALIVALAAVLLPIGGAAEGSASVSEYDVKAAFLLNIAKYADWPPQAHTGPGSPIVLGILGEDPFGPILDPGGGHTHDGAVFGGDRDLQVQAQGAEHAFEVLHPF